MTFCTKLNKYILNVVRVLTLCGEFVFECCNKYVVFCLDPKCRWHVPCLRSHSWDFWASGGELQTTDINIYNICTKQTNKTKKMLKERRSNSQPMKLKVCTLPPAVSLQLINSLSVNNWLCSCILRLSIAKALILSPMLIRGCFSPRKVKLTILTPGGGTQQNMALVPNLSTLSTGKIWDLSFVLTPTSQENSKCKCSLPHSKPSLPSPLSTWILDKKLIYVRTVFWVKDALQQAFAMTATDNATVGKHWDKHSVKKEVKKAWGPSLTLRNSL